MPRTIIAALMTSSVTGIGGDGTVGVIFYQIKSYPVCYLTQLHNKI
ncbi:hypothetical protein [Nitrososphaera sp. AFS]|nr:hypothetical protein [Nitrososphaera sp. AFS]